jgi:CheY-like chemotaxis protein
MGRYGSGSVLIPERQSRTVKFGRHVEGEKEMARMQKRVLLVEDDLEIRDVLQDLLEAEGYDVIPASHGRQALDYLEAAPMDGLPDLVVLDLMIPFVDGTQVLATMKGDPKLSPIPVVVLSAVVRELPLGASAFLPKPIPLQKLFDTIRDFVHPGPAAELTPIPA